MVSAYHSKYLKEPEIACNIEAYIQSAVLKATLELVTFDCCRGDLNGFEGMKAVEKAIERLGGTDAGAILEMLKDGRRLTLK